ncbi:MAG TPA: helix-turn-helix domain-containing protein [Streptomyces sp.]|nr:helix-turn-helix domain-containing protein [Streptomyces sp.]
MRADARRNRERIVQVAVGLFAEHGPGVSMEEIAQAAGLGVGTLYRHFPDRRSLLEEISVDTLTRLAAFVRAGAAEDVPRWQVLHEIVRYCVGQPVSLVKSLPDAPPMSATRLGLMGEVDEMLARLAEQAQEEGSLRRDITPEQVVGLLNVMLCRPGAREDDPLTRVMIEGLRA